MVDGRPFPACACDMGGRPVCRSTAIMGPTAGGIAWHTPRRGGDPRGWGYGQGGRSRAARAWGTTRNGVLQYQHSCFEE